MIAVSTTLVKKQHRNRICDGLQTNRNAADDIGTLSIHGASSKANEENETRIWNDIFINSLSAKSKGAAAQCCPGMDDHLITSKEHATVQINIADVDSNSHALNTSTTFALCG
ncbi:hypothetical protein K438DRAFT_1995484 [Mycena galopus ATCC 62051]|nr:hypothetical protein K438DRAFT_1995484 [Mycena galopus ATCC 62051]